ncbi:hypothetical protein EK21DRAFT_95354 [Setomelanomma holmii]|uniref:Uncharacterized protein n=1 Tax=Setomelanomma holmii TaxID=210430 RepID=A0A9P4GWT5_9PLEO|nr:hypothetical protein EK21DRAFT_95354 [Setomelanomma holmii]
MPPHSLDGERLNQSHIRLELEEAARCDSDEAESLIAARAKNKVMCKAIDSARSRSSAGNATKQRLKAKVAPRMSDDDMSDYDDSDDTMSCGEDELQEYTHDAERKKIKTSVTALGNTRRNNPSSKSTTRTIKTSTPVKSSSRAARPYAPKALAVPSSPTSSPPATVGAQLRGTHSLGLNLRGKRGSDAISLDEESPTETRLRSNPSVPRKKLRSVAGTKLTEKKANVKKPEAVKNQTGRVKRTLEPR